MTGALRAEVELQRGVVIARLAMAQFVVLCYASVQLQPDEFDWQNDYLSELGSFGTDSSLHAWLFNGSLVALGCGLMVMFQALLRAMSRHLDDLTVCASAGTAAAIAIMFIGLIPLDVSERWHTFAMALWLLFTVLALVFWADWRRTENADGRTSLGKLGVAAIVVYPVAVMLGRGPAMQKVIVLLSLMWLAWFSVQLEQGIRSGVVRKWRRRRKRGRSMRRARVWILEEPVGGENSDQGSS